MPLFNENTSLFAQSNTLWKSYLENSKSSIQEKYQHKYNKDFWLNYEGLIQQAKDAKPASTVFLGLNKGTNTQTITNIFFSHWKKPFNLQEHLAFNPPVKLSNTQSDEASQTRFFVIMLFIFLSGMFTLLFSKEILGFVIIIVSILFSLTKAYSMDTIDTTNRLPAYEFKVDNKNIHTHEILFEPNFLRYKFYDLQHEGAVKIHIPYTLINAIWKDERGIKIVGHNQSMWKDTQSQASHEVILPNEKLLGSFLSDVAMFNFSQKS